MQRLSLTLPRIAILWAVLSLPLSATRADDFDTQVRPVLAKYCFGCHADGANEGSMSFDELFEETDREEINQRWYKVLKQLQGGLMPPPGEDERPSDEESEKIQQWIKYTAFGLDRSDPDPGRVTIRRLNRVEYRNTIRDLLGVDYDTDANFPADDTGHGFDNIGDVLSVSPLLFEKYVNAATEIIDSTVPKVRGLIRTATLPGTRFTEEGSGEASPSAPREPGRGRFGRRRGLELSYYTPTTAHAKLPVEHNGDYTLKLNLRANETYVDGQFDENRCEFTFSLDGRELLKREFVRQGGKSLTFDFPTSLTEGEHSLTVVVKPLTEARQVRRLRIEVRSVELVGPRDPSLYVKPPRYRDFFPRDVPDDVQERREYASELLRSFASRAFRRPVTDSDVAQLVKLADRVQSGGGTFEAGVAKAMTAILASPQFLFREEPPTSGTGAEAFPLIDEYALASRLSYFFWSSMPDEELVTLAAKGELRRNLDRQVERMLSSEKSQAFFEHFVGQWLRARALDGAQINTAAVLRREPRRRSADATKRRERFFALIRRGADRTPEEEAEFLEIRASFRRANSRNGPRFDLNDQVRTAMRRETEMVFEHIVREDRPLVELLDADYTFLNQTLADHYEIPGVSDVRGNEMRLVKLPKDSYRGGVLTQGTTLVVTSNPDRTSPVKRGLFVLENLLGAPPPAAPPNIPALEDVDNVERLSLRETLAIHRRNVLCSSCHNRMDPLGLALENFNALGRYRTEELDQKIDSAGELATGEEFVGIRDLKAILIDKRRTDFYRCVTEKLMTYALGRAVEYTDAHTIDALVADLEKSDGRPSVLIKGLVNSSAFQRTRRSATARTAQRREEKRALQPNGAGD